MNNLLISKEAYNQPFLFQLLQNNIKIISLNQFAQLNNESLNYKRTTQTIN